MPKINYANLIQGISKGIGAIADTQASQSARTILENPKSTPVQKALAWETLSPGHGPKVYDTILKEQELKKKEEKNQFVKDKLKGVDSQDEDVGQRAEVGALPSYVSPVETANQMLSPEQAQQMGPEEMPYGQQLPNEPLTPAMQAMQAAQGQREPVIDQRQDQKQANGMDPYGHLTTPQLQELLGLTEDPATVRQLQSIIKDRQEDARNRTKLEASKVKGEMDIAEENRKEIRTYSEPYQNTQKYDKIVKDMHQARDIVYNSKSFSFDEGMLRTTLAGIIEGKESKAHLSEIFKTPEQQQMFNLMYDSLNPKALGGSNPSTREVLLSMSRQVSPYKGRAANMFIINNMLAVAEEEAAKSRIIIDERLNNPNARFPEFQDRVNQRVAEASEQIRKKNDYELKVFNAKDLVKMKPPRMGYNVMMDKETGNLKEVPANRVIEQQAKGKVLIQ